jgi:acyl-CoA reductase-like NAD-dependent aldehyde dehydrogenase
MVFCTAKCRYTDGLYRRAALIEFIKGLKVGDGFEEGVDLGPVQNFMQYDRVQGFFDDVEKENMKIAIGGWIANSKGYFINPTIVDNPKEDSKIVKEEPFGRFETKQSKLQC